MLTSAWLADDEHDTCVADRFLEVDVENFYLPTPPTFDAESETYLRGSSSTSGHNSPRKAKSDSSRTKSNAEDSKSDRRYYCPYCTTAFSRPDSMRRHQRLYCKNINHEKKPEQSPIRAKKGRKSS
ncbi:hypothetical protein QAD02_022615 [Eretmocerus hayati]|uniref:Uncharacterized protein n=1 Tax=Eretmocerus hayati TaxID=131215 RepID=A0ACC2PV52_9HYME|nr:hypothetical protein QAD02_022615 [Eretmocerus hayati]